MKSRLLGLGFLDEQKFDEALMVSDNEGEPLDQVLVKRNLVPERDMLRIVCEMMDFPFREDLSKEFAPVEFTTKVPVKFARNYHVCGLFMRDGILAAVTCRPLDMYALDELAGMVGCELSVAVAPREEVDSLINRSYSRAAEKDRKEDKALAELGEGEEDLDKLRTSENIIDDIDKAPVIRKVNSIFFNALKMRASDIHFQPYEYKLQVRYRIDGILYDIETIPKKVQELILTRVKVLGRMDIAERRLPQDGRAAIRVGDTEVDLRISSLPTPDGERIVLRILDKTTRIFTLEEIGIGPTDLTILNAYLGYANGIILVTGPTGSGKTTTLYSCLTKVNSPEVNVITVEDPIEYQLSGVSQVEVNTKKGLTFAAGLRSIVRQDPDVIMVGEIRDGETAGIAIQSALTGHLVFSTLHTNDAPGAVSRLVDLGAEPFLVASSLILVVAQRLVRVICERCREQVTPEKGLLESVGLRAEQFPGGKIWRGRGCDHCFKTGYVNRTGIYEMLPMTEAIKDMVVSNVSAVDIKKHAVQKEGMKTLRLDAVQKVLAGITTPEEVLRETQRDIF
ncbi:MAG: Flp pilus assembly complex ATPase component TadA [Planctomycetes bacterium]|nr:Flp pilus assembly complex ATPase component TadA [Planctomycetota bacterium]